MMKLRNVFNEKGQNLVEFILILAFCAALVYGLNTTGFPGAIRNVLRTYVFDNLTRVYGLGSFYTEAYNKWGQASDQDVIAADQAARLAADQAALLNIGGYFIGMTRSELEATFHLKPNQSNMVNTGQKFLVTKFLEDPDGAGTYAPKMQVDKDGNYYVSNNLDEDRTAGQIFKWIQGDYSKEIEVTFEDKDVNFLQSETQQKTVATEYNDSRFFFSDYTMINGKGASTGGDRGAGYSVKANFTYETKDGVSYVKKVELWLDPGSKDKGKDVRISSRGLWVTVENSNGTTITKAQNWDTGNLQVVNIDDPESFLP